ncbi:Hypothetical predicted protein [Paramuricea clavata]|uniref:Uncharacterized protein n=1 Tax=Paramuricea clavata TaxID=317549 RepID=A0A6S7G3N4_PARCT|nr:Hypothetical predicted protein [Paramuricea clavata]
MCENFKKIDAEITETGYDYFDNWADVRYNVTTQEELGDFMLMYIVQKKIHKKTEFSPYLAEDEWVEKSKPVVNEYAYFYAFDMLDDLSILYRFENLLDDVYGKRKREYLQPEKLKMLYELYVDYIRNGARANERIYKFVDEMLEDAESE